MNLCNNYYLIIGVYLYLLVSHVSSAVVTFPEPTDAITGLRSAGTASQSKQREVFRDLSEMVRNIQKAEDKYSACDECLKRGSGDIMFYILPDIITQKKQYTRGPENRITYDIYSKSDIPTSFYDKPFIDAKDDIMSSLLYSVEINEAPLQEFEQAKSTVQSILQESKKKFFKLVILAKQPLSQLSKIQKDYKKSSDVIVEYQKLNGVDNLPYAQGVDLNKFKQIYELNKPYYARKSGGNSPIIVCSQYADLVCTNQYPLRWSAEESQLQKKITVQVKYPLIPQELVIAPTLMKKLDKPNALNALDAKGFNKWWDCSNQDFGINTCVYNLGKSSQKFYANKPIQGTVRIGKGEISGNWRKCVDKKYKEANRKSCALILKDVWPKTVTRIKIEIMHPPKYDGEYAAIEFEQLAPKVHYFTTNTKDPNKNNPYSKSKMKHICFGDIVKCKNKYYGGTTANVAGSSTNMFLNRLWSKSVTLKLQNREDKLPLESKMFYKMKAKFISSTIWRQYLGFSFQPSFKENQLIFEMKARQLGMLEIKCEFEPKEVIVGENVEIYISVKNKQNGFLRSKLRSIYRRSNALTNKYQNIDVILTPIGNGNGQTENIGLEPIKNVVQIRKRDATNIKHAIKRDLKPAKFKVLSGGKQCVAFEIKGTGKRYYFDKKPQCMDVVGELKAEYIGLNDNDINTLINDEQSNKFKIIIKTGNAKLGGKVVLTPKINGVKGYEFNIDPPILDTKTCKSDCVLPFDFTPKLICAFDDNSEKSNINAKITWTVSYVVKGRNVYFPKPSPIKLEIVENQFDDDDELLDFKTEFPAKYERWKKCRDDKNDINILPPCNQIETPQNESIINIDNCIPSDDIDDDKEILNEIRENEKLQKGKNLKWYKNFWQENWDWQYAVIGSATVFILFSILKQLGCIGGDSILLEMLENMNVDLQQ